MSLTEKIVLFVRAWGPRDPNLHREFVDTLRLLMNEYAEAALIHGAIPEKGVRHGSGVKPKADA